MNLTDKILNYSYKRQKLTEAFAVFFVFLGVSFKFGEFGTKWMWSSYPFAAVLIAGISLIFILIRLKIEKIKIQKTINLIQNNSKKENSLDLLTERQKEVFDLILMNKTNKQITEELFIELSTLKTHINKIYKTLNIKNRKEVKQFKK